MATFCFCLQKLWAWKQLEKQILTVFVISLSQFLPSRILNDNFTEWLIFLFSKLFVIIVLLILFMISGCLIDCIYNWIFSLVFIHIMHYLIANINHIFLFHCYLSVSSMCVCMGIKGEIVGYLYWINKLGLSCAKLSLALAKLHTSLSSDKLKLATN